MNSKIFTLALVAAASLAAPVLAQEARDAVEVGQPYFGEEFGAWKLRCLKAEDGTDPCQLYQLLKDQNGNNVAEISVFTVPEGNRAVAGATIVVPLETLLSQGVSFKIDENEPISFAYTFCSQSGCVARIGFVAEELDLLKSGQAALMRIVAAANPEVPVVLNVGLDGFTKGFESLAPAAQQ